jgi:hypothetical protein
MQGAGRHRRCGEMPRSAPGGRRRASTNRDPLLADTGKGWRTQEKGGGRRWARSPGGGQPRRGGRPLAADGGAEKRRGGRPLAAQRIRRRYGGGRTARSRAQNRNAGRDGRMKQRPQRQQKREGGGRDGRPESWPRWQHSDSAKNLDQGQV